MRALIIIVSACLASVFFKSGLGIAKVSDDQEFDRKAWREEALANFPFEIRKVSGRDALKEWERLKAQGAGYPIVVGDDDELDLLLEPFNGTFQSYTGGPRSAEEILKTAADLRHPDSWLEYKAAEDARLEEYVRAQQAKSNADDKTNAAAQEMLDIAKGFPDKYGIDVEVVTPDQYASDNEGYEPAVGRWPMFTPASTGLSVAADVLTDKPLPEVNIILIPTDDWTTIPAHLRWGGWNDNPPAEYHVAALRSWRDRYGAELVGLSHDVMNIRVAEKPKTRDEALKLAWEHYGYCYDIVEQGTGTLAPLAASLKADGWWYFWWD